MNAPSLDERQSTPKQRYKLAAGRYRAHRAAIKRVSMWAGSAPHSKLADDTETANRIISKMPKVPRPPGYAPMPMEDDGSSAKAYRTYLARKMRELKHAAEQIETNKEWNSRLGIVGVHYPRVMSVAELLETSRAKSVPSAGMARLRMIESAIKCDIMMRESLASMRLARAAQ